MRPSQWALIDSVLPKHRAEPSSKPGLTESDNQSPMNAVVSCNSKTHARLRQAPLHGPDPPRVLGRGLPFLAGFGRETTQVLARVLARVLAMVFFGRVKHHLIMLLGHFDMSSFFGGSISYFEKAVQDSSRHTFSAYLMEMLTSNAGVVETRPHLSSSPAMRQSSFFSPRRLTYGKHHIDAMRGRFDDSPNTARAGRRDTDPPDGKKFQVRLLVFSG